MGKQWIFGILFFGISAAQAENSISWESPDDIINLSLTLQQLKQQTQMPVLFPEKIPGSTTRMYASKSSDPSGNYRRYWQINVDSTPDCKGTHYCNIGSLTAELGKKISLNYESLPDKNSHLKEPVKLKDDIIGYYTPFHVQASGIEPTLEWRQGNVTYTLQWYIPAEETQQKQILIDMVKKNLKVF